MNDMRQPLRCRCMIQLALERSSGPSDAGRITALQGKEEIVRIMFEHSSKAVYTHFDVCTYVGNGSNRGRQSFQSASTSKVDETSSRQHLVNLDFCWSTCSTRKYNW